MSTNVGLTTQFLRGWRALYGDSALPIGALVPGAGITIDGKTISVTPVDAVAGTYANPIVTVDETGRIMNIQEGSTPGLIPTDTLPDLAALEAYSGSAEFLLVLDAGDGRSGIYVQDGAEYSGPAYITGPAGRDGADGADGAQGVQGPAGPEGQRGADGLQGEVGPQGADGPQGPGGASGAEGQQGPQGPMGPIGATVLPDEYGNIDEDAIARIQAQGVRHFFLVNPAGDLRANKAVPSGIGSDMSLHLVGYSPATGWADYGQLTGAQGPSGLQGIQGPQGVAGLTGAQGNPGVRGLVGPEGPRGLQGETGAAGPAGPAGINGTNGAQGPQGERGLQGIQGLQGVAGVSGVQGEQGIRGENGFAWNARSVSQAGTTVGAESSGYVLFMSGSANTITVGPLTGSEYVDVSNSLTAGAVTVTHGTLTRTLYPGDVVRFYGSSSFYVVRRKEYPDFKGAMYATALSGARVTLNSNFNPVDVNRVVYNLGGYNFRPSGTADNAIVIPQGVNLIRFGYGLGFTGSIVVDTSYHFSIRKNGLFAYPGCPAMLGKFPYSTPRMSSVSGVLAVAEGDVFTLVFATSGTGERIPSEHTFWSIEVLG